MQLLQLKDAHLALDEDGLYYGGQVDILEVGGCSCE